MNFDEKRNGHGTREWSESSYNIGLGCRHNCAYGYCRAHALRFGLIARPEDWTTERCDARKVVKRFKKHKGVIMYPTMHDITPGPYLEGSVVVLRTMLEAGNRVLIVSKPHRESILRLCDELAPWKDQVEFRFTVGSMNDEELRLWEPGAPSFEERWHCFIYAATRGFSTSASMEPLLCDTAEAVRLAKALASVVSETVWLGTMNKVEERTAWCKDDPLIAHIIEQQLIRWRPRDVVHTVAALCREPKVRWKESIRNTVKRADPALAKMMEDKL